MKIAGLFTDLGRRRARLSRGLIVALLVGVAFQASPLFAQDATPPSDSIDETIQNDQPPFYVSARVDHSSRDYREGDQLALEVACEVDAYLYIEYQQADGKVYQIFPNSSQPDNRVAARQTVKIPGENDLFRWVVSAPFGKEIVKVIASRKPLDRLSRAEHRSKRFNLISRDDLKGIALELGDEPPAQWAEVDLEINTYPQDARIAASTGRRFGVFFGVAEFEFDEEAIEGSEDHHGYNLPAAHRDAQTLGRLMLDVGRLDEAKIFTNADATKANLEWSITEWLPSVSKPGDTVFIYFSSHCGQMPDDNGDEADGKDEYILPSDYVGTGAFETLMKRYKAGQMSDYDKARFEALAQKVQDGGGDGAALVRETGVTDDLFGRWVQHVSGRQVVVILDVCHAAGFDAQAKSFEGGEEPRFDFIEGEVARLKDIGQADQALFAACQQAETSAVRLENDLSVFTYTLVDCLKTNRGAIRLEDALKVSQEGMDRYFAEVNQGREPDQRMLFRPYLMNQCVEPVFLKP